MATPHGARTRVLIGAYDLSRWFNQADSSQTVDEAETTGFGLDDKTFVMGNREGSLNLGGFGAFDEDELDDVVSASLANDNGLLVLIARRGWVLGARAQIAKLKAGNYELASSVSDAVRATVAGKCDGGLNSGILLHQLTAESAAGNYTGQDNAASSANGLVAQLHVTAFTGTTATVKVQHSVDNSTWVDLITFTAVSGVTSERLSVAGTVNRYLRAQISSATITSMTFAVAAARL